MALHTRSDATMGHRPPAGLRRHTHTPAPPRFPTEIWCDIWERLPFSACIAVTHTCRAWRLTALAWPEIWTRPVFHTSISSLPLPNLRTERTNVDCAREVFERSGNRALHIQIDITTQDAYHFAILDLAAALSCVSYRTASICVRSVDLSAADIFLREIIRFPARTALSEPHLEHVCSYPMLRHISVQNLCAQADAQWHSHEVFFPREVDAPRLESVELAAGAEWPPGASNYPQLRRLSLSPVHCMYSDVAQALKACPFLECLSINLGAVMPLLKSSPAVYTPTLRSLTSGLRVVRIVNLCESYEAMALSVFNNPESREITIEGVTYSAVKHCGEIFSALGPGIHISALRDHDRVGVEGMDGSGKRRAVSCPCPRGPRDIMTRIVSGTDTDWDRVVRLTVTASHWFRFADALHSAPAVRSLTLVISTGAILDALPRWAVPTIPRRTKFPALRKLDVIGGDGAPKVAARDIAAVVRSIDIPLPLAVLGVDHRIFLGSRAVLCDLAEKVSVRVYRLRY
ncbi:hypothetical protein AURDEDRAFT_176547 [Auricularia subglabra TFB-10046 SS5]|uniref:Uncharacterized protein n=1 Tax=Auricularia subglabra (strain TFB-10046 / SS5) TaxID=717982 RepID=J0CVG7_AURST|nr:hypothetical protein AURDEDRAFT_176547 [Auricularia subglabra TFB-10046 SS5]